LLAASHERNVEAIHRAGADFVLSYTSLGVDSIMSLVNGNATVMLGEGVRLFEVRVPRSLAGQPLSKTGIGSRTGLSVVAVEANDRLTTQLTAETLLPEGGTLLMLGNADQRQQFAEAFEQAGR
jgi:voltage-gated potassium channel